MTILIQLDLFLSENFSDDYWGDSGIDTVSQMAVLLSKDEWKKLNQIWRLRSFQWQCRLANILDSVDSQYGIPLLLNMLSLCDDRVIFSLIDSLDGLDHSFEKYIHRVTKNTLERLKKAQRFSSSNEYHIIQRIYDRIAIKNP
jgi:hypothetical protein